MKVWKVILAVVVILVVVGEFSQATAKRGRGGGRSSSCDCPTVAREKLTPEQILELRKNFCTDFSGRGVGIVNLSGWANREIDSMKEYQGSGIDAPFVRVKNLELLPEYLRRFVGTTIARFPDCDETYISWQAPKSKMLIGDPKKLDEKDAYRVRVRFSCKECQIYERDLSESGPMAFVMEFWYESPFATLLLIGVFSACLAVVMIVGKKRN